MSDAKQDLLRTLVEAFARHTTRFAKMAQMPRLEGETIEFEPILRDEAGNIQRDGVLNLPARCDFVVRDEKGIKVKNLTVRTADKLIQGYFEIVGLSQIWVSPFTWNALDVQFGLDSDWPNFKPLRRWYLEWSLAQRDSHRRHTKGVLHRLTGPTPSETGWTISIDLGTAPPEAVLDLLDTLAAIGTRNVSLGANVSVNAH